MNEQVSTVVLVVRAATSARRASEIRRWIRALLPAALILISSAPLDADASNGVVNLSADEVDAGPLSVAAALARTKPGHE
jgi:hypothetical protein